MVAVIDGHRLLSHKMIEKVQDGFAKMLEPYEWECFFTCNYNYDMALSMSGIRAKKFFQKKFMPKVGWPGQSMSYFFVIENYKLGGIHGHGLCKQILFVG